MGLIERLTASAEDNSVFSRALQMRGSSSVDESTGDQSAVVVSSPNVTSSPIDTGAAVRALLKEIHLQRDLGIVTPSHLFAILHRHLQVTSGAILVPEQGRDAFSLMAAVGLDNTSRFRLRIPTETVRQICDRMGAVKLAGEERELMRPYLSVGEFIRHPMIAALPFFYNRDILAVLFIFDSPLLDLELDVLDVLLAAFSERAAYIIFDGRHKPFATARSNAILEKTHLPAVISRMRERSTREKRDLVVIRISVLPVLDAIRTVHPHLEQRYLLNDLLETCALLSGELFTLIHTAPGELLLVGLAGPYLDTELVVHLLGNTLQQLFGITPEATLRFATLDPDDLIRES